MKQKYIILKNDENTGLIIREYAELDKEIFSLLCEEVFEDKTVISAMDKGQDALIQTLRTQNLFPLGTYAKEIAAAVQKIYESGEDQPVELIFNDIDLLTKEEEEQPPLDEIEDKEVEIDDLLDEDVPEEDFDEKSDIKNLPYSLKISDDDDGGVDNDV
jgi:phage terminase Nu1 subunit (DNA packaging protein)